MKAKQATVKPKPVSQLEKHACFCPPTKHDTKLDQLNKAKEKQALFFFFFFFFLGGKDIHYTSAMIATSRVCDVHHKPKRPKLTTHLEWFRHES